MNVGERLSAVRKQKGFSQRELAKRADVTNSTISLIEQNRVSPSVGSLKKVLDGLPMSLAEFFAVDDDEHTTAFYAVDDQPNLGRDGINYFLIGAGKTDRDIEILREEMAPGTDTGEEMITHGGQEGGVVIAGELELTVDGETRVLGANEGYFFYGSQPHRFRAIGSETVKLVSANTSPKTRK